MASKDILKKAREAIGNKDYQTALKICKTILRDDKENYMALVFLGISLQETGSLDQVPKAFRKAIKINSENVLAWHGLANYYQKLTNEESPNDLIEVYTKLLGIEKNEQKLIEVCEKLSSMTLLQENVTLVVESLTNLLKDDASSKKLILTVRSLLISIISNLSITVPELYEVYEDSLLYMLNDSKLRTRQYYLQYLTLLYKRNKHELLFKKAEEMSETYLDDKTPLEWICKLFNEMTIENSDLVLIARDKIEKYSNSLLNLQSDSSMALFTKGVLFYQSNNFAESKEHLTRVTTLRPGLLHAWILLTNLNLKLYHFDEAVNSSSKADKLLQSIKDSNQNLRKQLNTLLSETFSRQSNIENLEKGVEICNKLINEDSKNSIFYKSLLRCYINLENYDQAHEVLLKLKEIETEDFMTTLLNAQLLRKKGLFQDALNIMGLMSGDIKFSEWWLEIGTLYWDLKRFEESLVPFLKATKLDANCYLNFLYLGRYYEKFNDGNKARRCYEKAFALNPNCDEIAMELSRLYTIEKKCDANIALLKSITGKIMNPKNKWAWIQLGLNYLEQEDYDHAIDTLRFIVRNDVNNSHCWESLADAYMARGAYTSALRCYQKSAEHKENSLYPLLKMANIKQALGEFAEAKADYEDIIKNNKHYVPALTGFAENCLLQAKYYRKHHLHGLAQDFAQFAIEKITIAIQEDNNLSCLWKLAGDSCLLVANLPEKYSCLYVLRSLAEGKPSEGKSVLEGSNLFEMAERCYCKALSIQNNVLLYHDLAVCFASHAQKCAESSERNELFNKSFSVIQHCTVENPTHWQHWNLMGIVAFKKEPKNYALAQHSFIKAVTVENNSAVAWCNLGLLYMLLGENYKLANEAFTQAQRADPNYVNSWIGQALVAENFAVDEAMDLFRHSTQLGIHPEGAIGYGHWVCSTLLKTPSQSFTYSIQNMHAVPVACDALTWYTENNPDDPCAWNMLGLLQERMGLNLNSAQSFRNAFRICDKEHMDKVKSNYGRLLFKLQKYDQAIDIFKTVKEATFSSGSWLALSLFKNKQYEESYGIYEQSLHWLTEEQTYQSDLLVALASMAYMFQGADAAKTLLFQSIQLKPPSAYGLYATCSLGLLHNDLNMANLVLNELNSIRDDLQSLKHYGILLSYTYLLEGKNTTAVRELSKLIHRYPNQASLWLTLSVTLLRLQKELPSFLNVILKCAKSAIALGRTNMDVSEVHCIMFMALYLTGDYSEALKMAQKAVHCFPYNAKTWAALISALHSNKKPTINISQYVLKDLNPSAALSDWLNMNRTMIV